MRDSIWREEFDSGADFVVGRPFLFGGVNYEPAKPGKPENPFDVKTTERQLRILYERRFINIAEPTPEIPPDEVKVPEEVKDEGVKGPVDDAGAEPDPTDENLPPSDPDKDSEADEEPGPVDDGVMAGPDVPEQPKPPELVKKAGGWYDVVDSDGKVLNKTSLRIEDAKRLIEEASHDLDVRRGPGE